MEDRSPKEFNRAGDKSENVRICDVRTFVISVAPDSPMGLEILQGRVQSFETARHILSRSGEVDRLGGRGYLGCKINIARLVATKVARRSGRPQQGVVRIDVRYTQHQSYSLMKASVIINSCGAIQRRELKRETRVRTWGLKGQLLNARMRSAQSEMFNAPTFLLTLTRCSRGTVGDVSASINVFAPGASELCIRREIRPVKSQ